MINFIWIILITIVASIISAAIVVFTIYLFYDQILSFILKRKIPKDRIKFLDGGRDIPKTEKEVNLEDGQFREFDKLRAIAIRERAAKSQNNIPRFVADEPRDVKINTIADEHNRTAVGEADSVDRRDTETW